jgi:stringent starvation protein B
MQPTRLPRKKDVVLQLLEQATVFVHLDPRAEAVRVPPWFKRQPQLVLQIGLNMAVPIPDLEVDDEGLSCTLSFNRSPFLCVIPWTSVFALVDDQRQGMVWPDDVPPELNQQAQQQAKPQPARPELKVAPAPAKESAAKESAKEAKQTKEKEASPKRRTRKTAAAKTPRAVPAKPARAAAQKPRAATKAQPKRAPAPAAEKAPVQKAAPAPAPAPAAAAAGASKRKLPPYLRVVK